MGDLGQASGRRVARWRAVAAVLSLYGLVLQAFLTGLNPVPVAAGAGILCPSHQAPAGSEPLAHAHACCTLGCPAPLTPPRPATAQAWPPRAAIVLSWSFAVETLARGPSARSASARGPPAA
ncbi:hypothetical protein VQ03_03570 [Methylobacterium tarhaniae]|uniref:DUF2946 domain-containing protein n=1 Tax=Methylobacterium tarhaniae TaxID=1187852 RepID=A0A0J6TF72_9HYPH|nr:hypothetical protein [Methylobacterium tarhaniae]KMO44348.1 hypothetical protein VQ03_03570 [Methylobacterium tarhaniae]